MFKIKVSTLATMSVATVAIAATVSLSEPLATENSIGSVSTQKQEAIQLAQTTQQTEAEKRREERRKAREARRKEREQRRRNRPRFGSSW